ncbi:hypothetical protein [Bacillus bombysepticus]|uniref:hypothetical protein n=1 Tax=Bacillus bombysepticus TaxID=658666 RepID=UPI0030177A56
MNRTNQEETEPTKKNKKRNGQEEIHNEVNNELLKVADCIKQPLFIDDKLVCSNMDRMSPMVNEKIGQYKLVNEEISVDFKLLVEEIMSVAQQIRFAAKDIQEIMGDYNDEVEGLMFESDGYKQLLLDALETSYDPEEILKSLHWNTLKVRDDSELLYESIDGILFEAETMFEALQKHVEHLNSISQRAEKAKQQLKQRLELLDDHCDN